MSDNEKDTISEYTYKTYDDYFTDYNITAETITEEDLTGSGTATDPYVVHSTNGFLWLSNYTISRINLASKYLELACDVVLNDETFDENGTPSGGDGVVYDWTQINTDCGSLSIDGNGHSIYGLYQNKPNGQDIGLFGLVWLKEVKNINISDFYIYAKWYASAFGAREISSISNCVVRDGFIIAEQERASGFCHQAKFVSDCKNYATVKSINGDNVAGIIIILNNGGKIKNCQNYGAISSNKGSVAGIVYGASIDCVIENCANYGELFCNKGSYVGGIVSDGSCAEFVNCVNYGSLTGNISGGIVGQIRSNCQFLNCANYGEILSFVEGRNGGMIGRVYSSAMDINIIVKDFVQKAQTNNAVIGMVDNMSYSIEVHISNIRCEYNGGSQEDIYCLLGENDKDNTKIFVENFFVYCETAKILALVRNANKVDLSISNVLFEVKAVTRTSNFFKGWGTEKKFVFEKGFVVSHITGESAYYGTDFSGFYCDWKTGKIGLKALSGKGFYQGEVSEEVLQNKGYLQIKI